MDLFEDTVPAPSNSPEYTVSELSGAVKKVIEGEFGLVRVRGEVGRLSRPASGHLYFALKDDKASLDAVSWKGQVARMQVRPEEGMEVIATGRMKGENCDACWWGHRVQMGAHFLILMGTSGDKDLSWVWSLAQT